MGLMLTGNETLHDFAFQVYQYHLPKLRNQYLNLYVHMIICNCGLISFPKTHSSSIALPDPSTRMRTDEAPGDWARKRFTLDGLGT